jgi:hypothetical protein
MLEPPIVNAIPSLPIAIDFSDITDVVDIEVLNIQDMPLLLEL